MGTKIVNLLTAFLHYPFKTLVDSFQVAVHGENGQSFNSVTQDKILEHI